MKRGTHMSHNTEVGAEQRPRAVEVARVSVPLTAAVTWWLLQLHARAAGGAGSTGWGHWLRDCGFALPLVMVATYLALRIAGRLRHADGAGPLSAARATEPAPAASAMLEAAERGPA